MTTPPVEPGTSQRAPASSRTSVLLLLLVLLATVGAGIASRSVTEPVGEEAAAGVFSAARATRAVSPVVAEPRPVGSQAAGRAQEELATQLTALGFEVRAQDALGARVEGAGASTGYVRNLIATRPGTAPTGTLVLATHTDSVPNAPGAADAGVGLAVILETVRALGPEAQRNDLVVLLVDGEERGLLGAEAFLAEGADELTPPVAVLNHEARGVSGRPMVTRTNGPMHAVIGSAPHPEFESFTDALFSVIPNDTDFTVYREGGWWGMDMAIIDDSWAYHSAQDDAAHLDPGTLQHYGDLTLALSRDLAQRDLAGLTAREGERPVQTTVPWGVVQVPPALMTGLAVAAPLAVLAAGLVRRRRGEVSLRGIALGAAVFALVLAAGVLGGVGLWALAAAASPEMLSQTMGEPVRAELFVLAEVMAAVTAVCTGWVLARLLISRAALLLGASLSVTTMLAVLGVHSPALGGFLILPAASAAGGTLLMSLLPRRAGPAGTGVAMLALLPTGWMLGTQLHALAEFGIASSAGGLAGTALVGIGAAAPLLLAAGPGTAAPSTRRRRRLPAPVLPAVLTGALLVGGTAWTLAAVEPVQESVVAHVDGTSGATSWETSGSTDWGRELDGSSAVSDMPAPGLEVERNQGTEVEIVLTAARDASAFTLTPEQGVLTAVSVDGVEVEDGGGLESLHIHGLRAGRRVVVTADADRGQRITAVETAYDPSLAGGWTAPGEGISLREPRTEMTLTAEL